MLWHTCGCCGSDSARLRSDLNGGACRASFRLCCWCLVGRGRGVRGARGCGGGCRCYRGGGLFRTILLLLLLLLMLLLLLLLLSSHYNAHLATAVSCSSSTGLLLLLWDRRAACLRCRLLLLLLLLLLWLFTIIGGCCNRVLGHNAVRQLFVKLIDYKNEN